MSTATVEARKCAQSFLIDTTQVTEAQLTHRMGHVETVFIISRPSSCAWMQRHKLRQRLEILRLLYITKRKRLEILRLLYITKRKRLEILRLF